MGFIYGTPFWPFASGRGDSMSHVQEFTTACRETISRYILGKEQVIDKILAAMLSGGHVLLNDVPGTGKTLLARTLALCFHGVFHRIQFTPDLLPSDVTGVNIFDPKSQSFHFQPGPAFSNILLADEINRGTPRTQSALLECMEEHQVTVDGVTYPLEPPFFVIATQNPVEMQGTFPLPEAQLDRFLLCLSLGYPDRASEMQLLTKPEPEPDPSPVYEPQDLLFVRQELVQIYVSEAVAGYATDFAEAVRSHEKVRLGLSTRGLLAWMQIAKAVAAMEGRAFVTPDDLKFVAPDCIAHRLILRGNTWDEGNDTARALVEDIARTVPVPKEKQEY